MPDELDGGVQVGLALRETLGERERIAGLDQDMQSPASDLVALALVMFGDLSHLLTRIRPSLDEPSPLELAD